MYVNVAVLKEMPIFDVDQAKKALVIKCGEAQGYAGIVNTLFYGANCSMVYGDAAPSS